MYLTEPETSGARAASCTMLQSFEVIAGIRYVGTHSVSMKSKSVIVGCLVYKTSPEILLYYTWAKGHDPLTQNPRAFPWTNT